MLIFFVERRVASRCRGAFYLGSRFRVFRLEGRLRVCRRRTPLARLKSNIRVATSAFNYLVSFILDFFLSICLQYTHHVTRPSSIKSRSTMLLPTIYPPLSRFLVHTSADWDLDLWRRSLMRVVRRSSCEECDDPQAELTSPAVDMPREFK